VPEGELQDFAIRPDHEIFPRLFAGFFPAYLKKGSANHRVDNQRHEKGGRKHYDEGNGKELHEFAHNIGPEKHWTESTERGHSRGDYGPSYLPGGYFRRLHSGFTFLHVPVNVLYDNDSVIYQHPEGNNQ